MAQPQTCRIVDASYAELVRDELNLFRSHGSFTDITFVVVECASFRQHAHSSILGRVSPLIRRAMAAMSCSCGTTLCPHASPHLTFIIEGFQKPVVDSLLNTIYGHGSKVDRGVWPQMIQLARALGIPLQAPEAIQVEPQVVAPPPTRTIATKTEPIEVVIVESDEEMPKPNEATPEPDKEATPGSCARGEPEARAPQKRGPKPKKPLICHSCPNLIFSTTRRLLNHLVITHYCRELVALPPQVTPCSGCQTVIGSPKAIAWHLWTVHRILHQVLTPRDKTLYGKMIRKHEDALNAKVREKCPKCDAEFRTEESVRAHQVSFHRDVRERVTAKYIQKNACLVCGFVASQPRILLNHVGVHHASAEDLATA